MSRLIRPVAFTAIVLVLAACGADTPANVAPTTAPEQTTGPVVSTDTVAPSSATVQPTAVALVANWTRTLTKQDILRVEPDFKRAFLCDSSGTTAWQFKSDGTYSQDQTEPLPGCPKPEQTHLESTWSNAGNLVTFGKGGPEEMVYKWEVGDNMLTLVYRSGSCIPCRATDTAKAWRRVK